MEGTQNSKGKHFYIIGLSYKKADAHIRGHFSLDEQAKERLLEQAKEEGIDAILVTSTCNRTEIYGFAQHPFQLIKLLCEHTHGTVEEFEKVAYVYKNKQAVSHLFRVGTGLDSQILGDFEIISQLKIAFVRSKNLGLVNAYLERLINAVIQASKRIKNETEISSGATSVSFASVQYILNTIEKVSEKNILLFGTGKIGRNTCENLVKHTRNNHITLINRTKDKAEKIAGKFNLIVKDYADLQAEIRNADILIVATGAQNPTISKELIYSKKQLLILDLSIPKNVAEDVTELENVQLVHLDHLSQMTDETLERRKQFIPQAEKIIVEIEGEFNQWLETRKFAPTIKALKKKLRSMKDAEMDFQRKKIADFNDEHAEIVTNRMIQKIMKHFANHLKEDAASTDESLELIQKVFQLEEVHQ
ncbi:MAG: glutamyl-tRNA reductase [Bacteroidota bacterium]|uniref:Glutamyl-tRNA reductase n=1 Tax=Christiangramia flava JLT2011 TaxID=1229726 RepID=A0A1L7I495_9FLAO|nr:glutamyl-tRNA reductase [Christiangramia flava]APU68024.1 Glutamyl-tRNA reductase [Christiangramia flava JLT2011]MAM19416.1 glutamyl-tRNA reductase [Christiangramia sp.]MEE2772776.1 glutamyl-tRNA reductase [Bacteroidota bacterium]OSS40525.1 Glutamyl-tRNA reductase [Christiangramia flava JLT2011]